MSDTKGFPNALLIMLSDDSSSQGGTKDDSRRSSLEDITAITPKNGNKRVSIYNLISKDLMKSLDEDTMVKEDYYNKFNYSYNYPMDASDEKVPRHIRKGWVCVSCFNFNWEFKAVL